MKKTQMITFKVLNMLTVLGMVAASGASSGAVEKMKSGHARVTRQELTRSKARVMRPRLLAGTIKPIKRLREV